MLADRVLCSSEKSRGQFVTDQNNLITAWLIFIGRESPSSEELRTENVEEGAGHAFGVDLLCAHRHSEIHVVELICGYAGEGAIGCGQKREIRKRYAATAIAASADAHQLTGILIRKRAKQY